MSEEQEKLLAYENRLAEMKAELDLRNGEIARLSAVIEAQKKEIKRLNDGWAAAFTALEAVYRVTVLVPPFTPTGQGLGNG